MDKYIRNTIADDIEFLAANMRPEDVEEVEAIGITPLYALRHGFEHSDICLTMLGSDGVPIGMYGVAKSNYSQLGAIWLLGTKGIEGNAMLFLRHSREALDRLWSNTAYDGFYNLSYAHNALHHRWLKWLGFTFLREVKLPPHNKSFYEFVKLRG